jgi:hypothetical protein
MRLRVSREQGMVVGYIRLRILRSSWALKRVLAGATSTKTINCGCCYRKWTIAGRRAAPSGGCGSCGVRCSLGLGTQGPRPEVSRRPHRV